MNEEDRKLTFPKKPQKYRKKPVVIEAMQWDGGIETRNILGEWLGDKFLTHGEYDHPSIRTLEGDHLCNIGDFIVKGVKGEFYPVKPDIFKMTYEKVL